jgi:hypothetical protein
MLAAFVIYISILSLNLRIRLYGSATYRLRTSRTLFRIKSKLAAFLIYILMQVYLCGALASCPRGGLAGLAWDELALS